MGRLWNGGMGSLENLAGLVGCFLWVALNPLVDLGNNALYLAGCSTNKGFFICQCLF